MPISHRLRFEKARWIHGNSTCAAMIPTVLPAILNMAAAPAMVRRIDSVGPTGIHGVQRIGFVAAMRLLDDLLSSLRTCFETFPDGRRGANGQYSIADFGMSAFSAFFMQCPSFLAHQRRLEEGHGRSNCQSLFGMGKIPSDNRIRDMLDPALPGLLNPVFFEIGSIHPPC